MDLQGDGKNILQLRFEEIEDFHPDRIFHQVSLFSDLRETRKRLINPQTFDDAAREVRSWSSESKTDESPQDKIAEKILEEGLMPMLSFRDSDRVRLARFQSIALPSAPLNGKWTSLKVS